MKDNDDKCTKCKASIVDGGHWGYCDPCWHWIVDEDRCERCGRTNKKLQETNDDKCLKCEVPVVDGGDWGYCTPCFNEEADAYINKKLQETNDENGK